MQTTWMMCGVWWAPTSRGGWTRRFGIHIRLKMTMRGRLSETNQTTNASAASASCGEFMTCDHKVSMFHMNEESLGLFCISNVIERWQVIIDEKMKNNDWKSNVVGKWSWTAPTNYLDVKERPLNGWKDAERSIRLQLKHALPFPD